MTNSNGIGFSAGLRLRLLQASSYAIRQLL